MRRARVGMCAAGAAVALTLCASSALAVSDVVISQIYGGGGNTGSFYRQDFIEIFNRGTSPVDITNWSVQYNSATGTGSFQVTPLTGGSQPNSSFILQPGQYFLIQEAVGGGGTQDIPTPDAIGNISMSATVGRVALVNNITALSGGSTCAALKAASVDFVGFGGTANCSEGSGPTPAPSNTTSVSRKLNGCTDTDDNATDFTAGTVTPRNSQTTPVPCAGLNLAAAATPNVIFSGDSTLLTGTPFGGNGPGSYTVRVNLTTVDASLPNNQLLFDNGTNGDVTPNDGIYSYRLSLASLCNPSTGFGDKTLAFSVNDGSTTVNQNVTLTVNNGNSLTPGITPPTGGTPDNGQPENAKRCVGETASFSVGAEGGNLSYQWFKGTPPTGTLLNNAGNISGATSSRLFVGNLSVADAGSYYCVVSGGCSGTQITLGPATLTVDTTGGATATQKMVVIREIFGNGGNASAIYKYDYVQLFNTSTTDTVDVSNWSIQWATAGTFQPIFDRPSRRAIIPNGTTIAPGRYLLIKLFNGPNNPPVGSPAFPEPSLDLTGQNGGLGVNLNPTAGKVGLFSVDTSSSGTCPYGDNPNPSSCHLVDFVGWDTTAGCSETSPAPNMNFGVLFRANVCAGGTDNSTDFQQSNSPRPLASGTSGAAEITTEPTNANACFGGTANFGVGSRGDCRTFQWYDSNGPLTEGGDYVGTQTANLAISNVDANKVADGPYYVIVSTPWGNDTSNSVEIVVDPANADDKQVVVSQVYPGGGNTGATYQNDFVELYNKGTTSVSLSGWSVQYASAAGTSWSASPLSGTIAPGEYFLLKLAAGSSCSSAPCGIVLPTANLTDTSINMGAAGGKIALVKTTGTLTGACPTSDCRMVDYVGYGTANCFDGLNPAPAPVDASQSVTRNPVCNDSNNNGADFVSQAVNPHGAQSALVADLNNDGVVNGNVAGAMNDDLDFHAACRTGDRVPYDPQNLPSGCNFTPDCNGRIRPDFDKDGDVDQRDFAKLQADYTAP